MLANDVRLRWLTAAVLPIFLPTMYVPILAHFFELTPLTVSQWGLALMSATPAFALCLMWDRFDRPGERGTSGYGFGQK